METAAGITRSTVLLGSCLSHPHLLLLRRLTAPLLPTSPGSPAGPAAPAPPNPSCGQREGWGVLCSPSSPVEPVLHSCYFCSSCSCCWMYMCRAGMLPSNSPFPERPLLTRSPGNLSRGF